MDKDLILAIDELLSYDCHIYNNELGYTLTGSSGTFYEVTDECNNVIYDGDEIEMAIKAFDI